MLECARVTGPVGSCIASFMSVAVVFTIKILVFLSRVGVELKMQHTGKYIRLVNKGRVQLRYNHTVYCYSIRISVGIHHDSTGRIAIALYNDIKEFHQRPHDRLGLGPGYRAIADERNTDSKSDLNFRLLRPRLQL